MNFRDALKKMTWFLWQLPKDLVFSGSPGECPMIDHFLRNAFGVLSSPYCSTGCSAVFCSAADTHLKLLYRAVSGARFPTGGVFEYNIGHRRSFSVLCMLYMIGCNPMNPLRDALPGPHVSVRVTRGAQGVHLYTYAPPRCRTSRYFWTFVPFSVFFWNNLRTPYSMVWDWPISRAGPMIFY